MTPTRFPSTRLSAQPASPASPAPTMLPVTPHTTVEDLALFLDNEHRLAEYERRRRLVCVEDSGAQHMPVLISRINYHEGSGRLKTVIHVQYILEHLAGLPTLHNRRDAVRSVLNRPDQDLTPGALLAPVRALALKERSRQGSRNGYSREIEALPDQLAEDVGLDGFRALRKILARLPNICGLRTAEALLKVLEDDIERMSATEQRALFHAVELLCRQAPPMAAGLSEPVCRMLELIDLLRIRSQASRDLLRQAPQVDLAQVRERLSTVAQFLAAMHAMQNSDIAYARPALMAPPPDPAAGAHAIGQRPCALMPVTKTRLPSMPAPRSASPSTSVAARAPAPGPAPAPAGPTTAALETSRGGHGRKNGHRGPVHDPAIRHARHGHRHRAPGKRTVSDAGATPRQVAPVRAPIATAPAGLTSDSLVFSSLEESRSEYMNDFRLAFHCASDKLRNLAGEAEKKAMERFLKGLGDWRLPQHPDDQLASLVAEIEAQELDRSELETLRRAVGIMLDPLVSYLHTSASPSSKTGATVLSLQRAADADRQARTPPASPAREREDDMVRSSGAAAGSVPAQTHAGTADKKSDGANDALENAAAKNMEKSVGKSMGKSASRQAAGSEDRSGKDRHDRAGRSAGKDANRSANSSAGKSAGKNGRKGVDESAGKRSGRSAARIAGVAGTGKRHGETSHSLAESSSHAASETRGQVTPRGAAATRQIAAASAPVLREPADTMLSLKFYLRLLGSALEVSLGVRRDDFSPRRLEPAGGLSKNRDGSESAGLHGETGSGSGIERSGERGVDRSVERSMERSGGQGSMERSGGQGSMGRSLGARLGRSTGSESGRDASVDGSRLRERRVRSGEYPSNAGGKPEPVARRLDFGGPPAPGPQAQEEIHAS